MDSFDVAIIDNLMIFTTTVKLILTKLISVNINFLHLKDCHVLSFHQIKICRILKCNLTAILSNFIQSLFCPYSSPHIL